MARGITRKELKRDELVEATVDASHWLEEHWQKVAAALGVVIVVGLGTGFWFWNAGQNRIKAQDLLAGAIQGLQQAEEGGYADPSSIEALIPTLDEAADRAGNDATGSTARYYQGVVLHRLGRDDDAQPLLEAVLASASAPLSLRAATHAMLARIEGESGRPEVALERWNTMIADGEGSYPIDQALLEAGKLHRRLGDDAAARAAWQRIVDEYPAGGAVNEARRLLGA